MGRQQRHSHSAESCHSSDSSLQRYLVELSDESARLGKVSRESNSHQRS